MGNVKFVSSVNTVKCECGKVIDVDKATMLPEDIGWLCPECVEECKEEYRQEKLNNFKSEHHD